MENVLIDQASVAFSVDELRIGGESLSGTFFGGRNFLKLVSDRAKIDNGVAEHRVLVNFKGTSRPDFMVGCDLAISPITAAIPHSTSAYILCCMTMMPPRHVMHMYH